MGLMSKLWKAPLIGKRFKRMTIKAEGGEQTSQTLRRFTAESYQVDVGLYTYGSCFEKSFNTGGKVTVGKYCSFGPDVHYYGANHPIDSAVMSPYFYNRAFSGLDVTDVVRHQLSIGHDVWIGHGVILVSSCHSIGNGAVIAAGSVVTKDVPAYAIVSGVPAKILRYRFSKDVTEQLEESKWWEKTPHELMKYYELIKQPEEWAKAIINSL